MMNDFFDRLDGFELRAIPTHDLIHAQAFNSSMCEPEKVKALSKLDRLHALLQHTFQLRAMG